MQAKDHRSQRQFQTLPAGYETTKAKAYIAVVANACKCPKYPNRMASTVETCMECGTSLQKVLELDAKQRQS